MTVVGAITSMNDSLLSDSKFYSAENAGSLCGILALGGGSQRRFTRKALKVRHPLPESLYFNGRTKTRGIACFQDSIKLLSESHSGRGGI
jgi:hypothetical protein